MVYLPINDAYDMSIFGCIEHQIFSGVAQTRALIMIGAPFWQKLPKNQQIEAQELNVRTTLEEFFVFKNYSGSSSLNKGL